ncbi:DUF29 domain-containing protein [Azospirillum halopraeferens]|uniref:DUF29 domain-containing protein n=1 Tax=Azospirillum halopraeferens TaxID=34010 RepID=UPI00041834EF|nr:DUF29 domain-containing protein [Azospirillum halopraeferens]
MGHTARYDEDFYAWTVDQAARLREAASSGANLPVDWENLAEEVESMGRSDRRALGNQLARVLEHLLKLEHSPARLPRRGWKLSVVDGRRAAIDILNDSPSLRAKLDEILDPAWARGRKDATGSLKTDTISDDAVPADCPYTIGQILDEDWWPANRHGVA